MPPKKAAKNPRKPRLTPEDIERAPDILSVAAIGKQGIRKYGTELKIWEVDLKHDLFHDIQDSVLAKYLSGRWLQLKTHSCLKTSLAFIFRLLLLRGKPGYNRRTKHKYPCLNSAVEAIHSHPDYVKDPKEDEFVEFTIDDCILLLNSLWALYFDVRNEKWISLNDEAVQLAAVIVLCCFCSFRADDLALLHCHGVSFRNNENGVFECTVKLTNPHGEKENKNAKKKNSNTKYNRPMVAIMTCACVADVQTTFLMNPLCGAHIMYVMMESMDDNQGELRVIRNVNAQSHRFTTQNMGARRIGTELAEKMNSQLPESYNGRVTLTLKHLKQTGITLKTHLCGGDMAAVKVTSRHLSEGAAKRYVKQLQQHRDQDVMREVSNRLNEKFAKEGSATATKFPEAQIVVQPPKNVPTIQTHTTIPRDILVAIDDNTSVGLIETNSTIAASQQHTTKESTNTITSVNSSVASSLPTNTANLPAQVSKTSTTTNNVQPTTDNIQQDVMPPSNIVEQDAPPIVQQSASPNTLSTSTTVQNVPVTDRSDIPSGITTIQPRLPPTKQPQVPPKLTFTQPRLPPTKQPQVPPKLTFTQPRPPPTKQPQVPPKVTMTQPRLPPTKKPQVPPKLTMTQPKIPASKIPTKITMTQPRAPITHTSTQNNNPDTSAPSTVTTATTVTESTHEPDYDKFDDFDGFLSPTTAVKLTELVDEAEKSFSVTRQEVQQNQITDKSNTSGSDSEDADVTGRLPYTHADKPVELRSPKSARYNPVLRLTPKPKKARKPREPLEPNKQPKRRKQKEKVPLSAKRNIFDEKENIPPLRMSQPSSILSSSSSQSQTLSTITTHNNIHNSTPTQENVTVESVQDVSPIANTTTTTTHFHSHVQQTQDSLQLQQKDKELEELKAMVQQMRQELDSRPIVTPAQPMPPVQRPNPQYKPILPSISRSSPALTTNTSFELSDANTNTSIVPMTNTSTNTTQNSANLPPGMQLIPSDQQLQPQNNFMDAFLAQQQQQLHYMQLLQKQFTKNTPQVPDPQANQPRDVTTNHGCNITHNYYRM